jgi:hypothetical protein
MGRTSLQSLCLIVALSCVPLFANTLAAQPSQNTQAAGSATKGMEAMDTELFARVVSTWRLVSFNIRDQSGNITYPFGKDAQGRIIYEANGRMAVQVMNPNRPKLSSCGKGALPTSCRSAAAAGR